MATVWWLEAPLVLLTTSTLLVATSAIVASAPKQPAMLAWALADLYDDDDDADDDDDDDSDGKRQSRGVVLGMPAVMMYPLLASIVLVGMYWFTAYVSWLLLLSHIVSGVFGMSVGLDAALLLLLLLLSGSPSSSRAATSTTATGESSMLQSRLCAAIAILCVGAWIWTNSVVLANGACECTRRQASLVRSAELERVYSDCHVAVYHHGGCDTCAIAQGHHGAVGGAVLLRYLLGTWGGVSTTAIWLYG